MGGYSYFLNDPRQQQRPRNVWEQASDRLRKERQLDRQNQMEVLQIRQQAERNRYYQEQARERARQQALSQFASEASSKARQEAQNLNTEIRNRLKSGDPAKVREELEQIRQGFAEKHKAALHFDPTLAEDFNNTINRYATDIDQDLEKKRQSDIDWEVSNRIRLIERAVQDGQMPPQEAYQQVQLLSDLVRNAGLDETRTRSFMKRVDDFDYRTQNYIKDQREAAAREAEKREEENIKAEEAYYLVNQKTRQALNESTLGSRELNALGERAARALYAQQGVEDPEMEPGFQDTVRHYTEMFAQPGGVGVTIGGQVFSSKQSERQALERALAVVEGRDPDSQFADPTQRRIFSNKYARQAREQLRNQILEQLKALEGDRGAEIPGTSGVALEAGEAELRQQEAPEARGVGFWPSVQETIGTSRIEGMPGQERAVTNAPEDANVGDALRVMSGAFREAGQRYGDIPAGVIAGFAEQRAQVEDVLQGGSTKAPEDLWDLIKRASFQRWSAMPEDRRKADDVRGLVVQGMNYLEPAIQKFGEYAGTGTEAFLKPLMGEQAAQNVGMLASAVAESGARIPAMLLLSVLEDPTTVAGFRGVVGTVGKMDALMGAFGVVSLSGSAAEEVGAAAELGGQWLTETDPKKKQQLLQQALEHATQAVVLGVLGRAGTRGLQADAARIAKARRDRIEARDAAKKMDAAQDMASEENFWRDFEAARAEDTDRTDYINAEREAYEVKPVEDLAADIRGAQRIRQLALPAGDRPALPAGRQPLQLQPGKQIFEQPASSIPEPRQITPVRQEVAEAVAREDFDALQKLDPWLMKLVQIAADVEKIWEPDARLRAIMEYENRNVSPQVEGSALGAYDKQLSSLEKQLNAARRKAGDVKKEATKKKYRDQAAALEKQIAEVRKQLRIEQTTAEGRFTEATRSERRKARRTGKEATLREGGAQQWAADLLKQQFGERAATRLMQAYQTGEYGRFREQRAGGPVTQGKDVRRGTLPSGERAPGMPLSVRQPGSPVAENRGWRVGDLLSGGEDALAARAEKLANDRKISLHQANNILRNEIRNKRRVIDPILNKAAEGKELTDADMAALHEVLGSDMTVRAAVQMAQRGGFEDLRPTKAPEKLSDAERQARSREEKKRAREVLGLEEGESPPTKPTADPDTIRAELDKAKKAWLASKAPEGSPEDMALGKKVRDLDEQLKAATGDTTRQKKVVKRLRSELSRDIDKGGVGEVGKGEPPNARVAGLELRYLVERAKRLRAMLGERTPDAKTEGRKPGPLRQASDRAQRAAIGEEVAATESRAAELRRYIESQKAEPRRPKQEAPKGGKGAIELAGETPPQKPTGLGNTAADLRRSIRAMLDQRVKPGDRGAVMGRLREAQSKLADQPDAKPSEITAEIDRLLDEPANKQGRAAREAKILELERRLESRRNKGSGKGLALEERLAGGLRRAQERVREEGTSPRPKPGALPSKGGSLEERLRGIEKDLGEATGLKKIGLIGARSVMTGALRADLRTQIRNAVRAGDKGKALKLRKQLRALGGTEGTVMMNANRPITQQQMDSLSRLAVGIADGTVKLSTALAELAARGAKQIHTDYLKMRLERLGKGHLWKDADVEVKDPFERTLQAGVGEGDVGMSAEVPARAQNQNTRRFVDVNTKTGRYSDLGLQREASSRIPLMENVVRIEVKKDGTMRAVDYGSGGSIGRAMGILQGSDLGKHLNIKPSTEAGYARIDDLVKGAKEGFAKFKDSKYGRWAKIEEKIDSYRAMKDIRNLLFSAERRLKGMKSPDGDETGRQVYRNLRDFQDRKDKLAGKWLGPFEEVSRKLKKDVKAAGEEYMMKGSDGAKKIRAVLDDIWETWARVADEHGIPRPDRKEDYFPRIFDDRHFEERVAQLAEKYTKKGQLFEGKDPSDPAVIEAARQWINGGLDVQAWNRINGNLERPRKELSRQDYIRDLDIIAQYIDKAARRIAEVEQLGPGAKRVRELIKRKLSNQKTRGQGLSDAEYAMKVTRDMLGLSEVSPFTKDLQTFLSVSKLGTSMPLQFASAARTAAEFGVGPSMRSWAKIVEDLKRGGLDEVDIEAMKAGALSQNVGGIENVEFRAQRASDVSWFGKFWESHLPGYSWATKHMWGTEFGDRLTRVFDYNAAIDAIGVAVKKQDADFFKYDHPYFKTDLAEATKMVRDAERGVESGKEWLRERGKMAADKHYHRVGPLDTPTTWRSAVGRLFFQFSNFMYQHSRWVFGTSQKAARFAKEGNLNAAWRTFRPVVKFMMMFAPVFGEAALDMKAIMQGHGMIGEELDEDATFMEKMDAAMSNRRIKPKTLLDVQGWFWRLFQNTLGAAGIGVPQILWERVSRSKIGSEFMGPAFSELQRTFDIVNYAKEGDALGIASEVASYASIVGSDLRAGIKPYGNVAQNPRPGWLTRAYDAATGETSITDALLGGILGGEEYLSEGRRASGAAREAKRFEAKARDVSREIRELQAKRSGRKPEKRGQNLRAELAEARKARARWKANKRRLEALR